MIEKVNDFYLNDFHRVSAGFHYRLGKKVMEIVHYLMFSPLLKHLTINTTIKRKKYQQLK